MRLKGRVAVVTGASGGIGPSLCQRVIEERCSVVAADVNGGLLQKLAGLRR